jgi:ABC-2 type transport system ATP-binding protein
MIKVEHLVKEYKVQQRQEGLKGTIANLFNPSFVHKRAVDDLSFEIKEGELVGYIGPNGAGKSTSIKMLTGILTPSSGTVEVNGLVPYKNRKLNAQQIGVVFGQKTQLWWDVPVIDSLLLLRDIYKISDATYRKNLNVFNELLDLHEFQNTPVRQLSLGQRMRADLAAALLHNPRILFLDEPTIGVDIVAKEKLRNFIKEINQDQKITVLLTTHDMGDIEKLCNRMMIIDHGKMIYDGGVDQIRRTFGMERILIVEFEDVLSDFEVPHAKLIRIEEKRKWFQFHRLQTSPSQIITTIASRYNIVDLEVVEPEIEEMVRNIYAGQSVHGEVKGE